MMALKKCSYDCKSSLVKIPEFKFNPHISPNDNKYIAGKSN